MGGGNEYSLGVILHVNRFDIIPIVVLLIYLATSSMRSSIIVDFSSSVMPFHLQYSTQAHFHPRLSNSLSFIFVLPLTLVRVAFPEPFPLPPLHPFPSSRT